MARMSKEEYREFYGRSPENIRRQLPAPENDVSTERGSIRHSESRAGKVGKGAMSAGGDVLKKTGSIGGKILVSAVTSFGKGKFKGIRHPDSLIDPKMKELYIPNVNRCSPLGRKPTTRELYFGRSKSERE